MYEEVVALLPSLIRPRFLDFTFERFVTGRNVRRGGQVLAYLPSHSSPLLLVLAILQGTCKEIHGVQLGLLASQSVSQSVGQLQLSRFHVSSFKC